MNGAAPDTGDEIRVRCKSCGFVGTLDDFDVLGADDDKLFCNQCGNETCVEDVNATEPEPAPSGD